MRNFDKFFILFFIVLNFLSFSSVCYASKKDNHYIIFVHGIGDGAGRFRTTKKSLPSYLNKVDKIYKYTPLMYKYKTSTDVLNTYDFARGFGKFLVKSFKERTLTSRDRISIFAHSQGGIVSLNWLYDAYHQNGLFKGGQYLKHIYSFISFGSPYLGTQIVRIPLRIGTDIFKLFKFPVGKRQLQDMLYGSPLMDKMQEMALDNTKGFRDFLKHDLRFYNFVGNAGFYPTFSSANFGLKDDTAVPVTSAHLNFIHIKERGVKNLVSKMDIYDGIPFKIIKTGHIGLPFMKGMVEFPRSCASLIPCDHPAFFKSTEILLGHEYIDEPHVKKLVNSVVVHIKLFLDSKFPLKKDDFKSSDFIFRVFGNENIKIKDRPFYFNVKDAPASSGYKYRVDTYYSGKILSPELEEKSRSVLIFQDELRGNLHKFFNISVRRSYTTLIDSDFPSTH